MASKVAAQVTKKVSVSASIAAAVAIVKEPAAGIEHIVAIDSTGQYADEKVLVINPR